MSPAGEQAPRICTSSQEAQRQDSAPCCMGRRELCSDLDALQQAASAYPLQFKQFRAFSKEKNILFAFPFPTLGNGKVSMTAVTQAVHQAALLRSAFGCFAIKIP